MSFPSPALPPLRSQNRKGDLAEAAFVSRALRMGFNICKPVNTNCRYDFVVEAAGRYSRIQVKSVWRKPHSAGQYVVSVHGNKDRYRADEMDFFALYIVPEQAWYIIPRLAIGGRFTVRVTPHLTDRLERFERFREAWHLLLPRGVKIGDLKAQADPGSYQGAPSGVP